MNAFRGGNQLWCIFFRAARYPRRSPFVSSRPLALVAAAGPAGDLGEAFFRRARKEKPTRGGGGRVGLRSAFQSQAHARALGPATAQPGRADLKLRLVEWRMLARLFPRSEGDRQAGRVPSGLALVLV